MLSFFVSYKNFPLTKQYIFSNYQHYNIMTTTQNSVIIIGAGLSGLTAAEEILKACPSCKVTVLESMPAPGGRTRSVNVNGVKYDLGAQWVGPPQKYILALAKRAKHEMIAQNFDGKKIIQMGQNIEAYSQDLPQNFGKAWESELIQIIDKIQTLAKTVPLDCPKNCKKSQEWDSITIHSWIQLNVKQQKVKRFLQILVRSIYGCQTNQASFLFFLLYVHQNHGLYCMMNTKQGLQAYKFVQGTQGLSFFLEKQIKKNGGTIFYNSFVHRVIQTESDVTVQTRNGLAFKAQYLVIAAPPQLAKKIHFQPQLSRQRRFIIDRFIMAAFSKIIIQYDKRYWLEKGFSGEILSDCHDSPVLNAYDQTKIDQNGQMHPAIVVLVAANVDEQWDKNRQELQKKTIQKLASFFKSPQMLKPKKVIFKIWNQQEALGGAPTAYTPPGVLSKINNIRKPEGRIHFAGTQTALVSQGYMDGAVESGIRVSKEIIEKFQNSKQTRKQSPKKVQDRHTYTQKSNITIYSRL